MVASCSHRSTGKGAQALKEILTSQADFLSEDVWHLFKFGALQIADDKSWIQALVELCNEGHIARARLLDESLATLERDMYDSKASWYAQFHDALHPTVVERTQRLDSYLKLFSSPVPGKGIICP